MKTIFKVILCSFLISFISCNEEKEMYLNDKIEINDQSASFNAQSISSLIYEFRDSLSNSGYNAIVTKSGKPLWVI
ncbi:MAG: hypothetical protein IPO45_05380 [Saprospiraceae bacterium]|jgi:hypothetical protein|uniref:hypothetical protein n=1 Tax=Candidatus Brachybacter algidus TaxID=2982024 RepID=UPI001B7AB3D5|nr:hypothetical protein [Candidatus Brachybacter algidus]MBP7539609.1 hypothetical protein [Saprospiraceae bacterium]MBK6372199.1 hypothetical protein [Candidatus Brachybacter algidus]MBK6447550.1 hypothetical protein [Candidatus Brachybacter algidus]MBK8356797.1 hypothetical protein [Candidatus Brachybacter algidus]MBK8603759.1 hypothetical protein [Candidatus Brachybacter algidus]